MTRSPHDSAPTGTRPAGWQPDSSHPLSPATEQSTAPAAPPASTPRPPAAPGTSGGQAPSQVTAYPASPHAGPHSGLWPTATHQLPASGPKEIATLPPLPELGNESPTSKRTGEPIRPAIAVVALIIFQLAAAGVAFTYGWHWWRAAHPNTYAISARLIEWVDPDPGKWLALTLEGVLAAVAALVAGACGVAGFQAWNGWRWSRWAGVVALALTVTLTALFTWWGLIPLGLAVVGAALLFLPPMTRYFRAFEVFRATGRPAYRRPERIFYGRLPRYR